jgi:hypothetical protein
VAASSYGPAVSTISWKHSEKINGIIMGIRRL